MEWHEIHSFKDRLALIEQFFIELAANEEQLRMYGFKRAFLLPGAEEALKALKTFAEDFSALKRYVLRMDRSLSDELERLESEGRLTEQVALISLRLRMSEARKPVSAGLGAIGVVFAALPYIGKMITPRDLFGNEPVSLHKTIVNLGRLRGLTAVFSDWMFNRAVSDDEVFKPSNVNPDRVVLLIDAALAELESLGSLSDTDRERIEGYLHEAKREALSSRPSWAKIVGALVIVAAITSGLADAPGAAKNIKDAIEYILGTAVQKPLQKYLPPPDEQPRKVTPIGPIA